ncbi:MAG: nuclear transport factor 2 family protein [Ignavibacteria bacterium]|nr:nuclear transport factor 2 family protein [Ignavibacteria bacterium]
MKKLFLLCLAVYAFFMTSIGRSESDSAAIVRTVLNYGEGYYSGSPERMESALHSNLNKVAPEKIDENGNTILNYSTVSGLVELCREKIGILEESKRKISVTVFRFSDNIAFAKIMSSRFNDYLHLIKEDGNWKIINVLWTYGSDVKMKRPALDFDADKETEPVKEAVTGFYEAAYTGNDALIDKVLHTEYNGIMIAPIPSTGKYVIGKDGYSKIKEIVHSKMILLDKEKWNFQVNVIDIMDGLAAVEITSPNGINYMQLAKIDGQWKIINSIRKPAIVK